MPAKRRRSHSTYHHNSTSSMLLLLLTAVDADDDVHSFVAPHWHFKHLSMYHGCNDRHSAHEFPAFILTASIIIERNVLMMKLLYLRPYEVIRK